MVAVIDIVFDKALFEPLFGVMYSSLCAKCSERFPEFPDENNPGGKAHTFKRRDDGFARNTADSPRHHRLPGS